VLVPLELVPAAVLREELDVEPIEVVAPGVCGGFIEEKLWSVD
jgi:hypothetical protein